MLARQTFTALQHLSPMGATLLLTAGRTGGHLTVYQVGDLVRQVFPEPCTMHTLRAVQVLMSHWSIATTERYLAVDDEVRRREAVRAVRAMGPRA
jgi:integrase/recombinase XerC